MLVLPVSPCQTPLWIIIELSACAATALLADVLVPCRRCGSGFMTHASKAYKLQDSRELSQRQPSPAACSLHCKSPPFQAMPLTHNFPPFCRVILIHLEISNYLVNYASQPLPHLRVTLCNPLKHVQCSDNSILLIRGEGSCAVCCCSMSIHQQLRTSTAVL